MAKHFKLSGAGNITYGGANSVGWTNNLGCSLATGVFSIKDSAGAALSTTNPGWVYAPSTTSGQGVAIEVTSPFSFNDDNHASSDLTGLGFGITEAVNWGNDKPFYLYLANKANSKADGTDGGSVFFLASRPNLILTPSSSNDIGDTGAIPANDSQDVILIMADVTIANYTSLPCVCLGNIAMTWLASTTDWTVTALTTHYGIGFINEQFYWSMPLGQMGASSGTFIKPNGGTAPVFTTNRYLYKVSVEGLIHVQLYLSGDGGTDGAGAVQTQIVTPYLYVDSGTDSAYSGVATVDSVGGAATSQNVAMAVASYLFLTEPAGNTMQNGDFSNGSRFISGAISYRI